MFCVDDRMVGMTQSPPNQEFAAGFTAGWHTLSVERLRAGQAIEPVTLQIGQGEIVLIEGRTGYFDVHAESPTLTVQILPSGFACSGWWGARWARYLGWSPGRARTVREGVSWVDGAQRETAPEESVPAALMAFVARVVVEARRQGVAATSGPSRVRGRDGTPRVDVIAGRNVLMFRPSGASGVTVAASVMPDSKPGRVNTIGVDTTIDDVDTELLVALLRGEGDVKHRWPLGNGELTVGRGRAKLVLPVVSPDDRSGS